MSNMINPRVAIVFKKIFGVKKNKDILIAFINSIVGEEDQIDKIKLLNPYNEHDFKQEDLLTVAIKAKNKHNNGHLLIIVQLVDKKDYLKQGYSWSSIHSNQMLSDNLDQHINKTIMIYVLNFNFIDYGKIRKLKIPYVPEYHYKSTLRDSKTGAEIFKNLEIHTLELKKFAINATDLEGIAINIEKFLDQWMAFLTKYELLDAENLPEEINILEIQKALNILKEMSFSKNERDIYNLQLSTLHKRESEMNKNKSRKDIQNKKRLRFEAIVGSIKKCLEFFVKIYKK